MRTGPEASSRLKSKHAGATITAALALKILLTLNSCSTEKYLGKTNNSGIDSITLDSNEIRRKAEKDEQNRLAEEDRKLMVEQSKPEYDSIVQNISVSERPWKITVPGNGRSVEFTIQDPNSAVVFYYYDCPRVFSDDGIGDVDKGDHVIDTYIELQKEGTYRLFINPVWCKGDIPARVLATYDYKKPEIITPLNIQNGQLLLNQDITGPVKIIFMNLTDNTYQEVVVNKDFKKSDTFDVNQYLDISQIHGKNCCLIIQDGSGKTVFDEKFHKI